MQVVVLAGGLATRMEPLSGQLPKILFPVAGKPFLDHQLALLARGGATQVLLCVRHLAHKVEEHLAASSHPLPVILSDDGEQAAGTGGALVRALERNQLEPRFTVMYGDSYLPIDLRPLFAQHLASGLPATMAVLENDGRWDASNCIVEGQRVVRYEKIKDPSQRPAEMRWIDYGATALDRACVEGWPRTLPLDLIAPLTRLSKDGKLGAFTITERFYEIGSPAGLAELEAHLGAPLKASGPARGAIFFDRDLTLVGDAPAGLASSAAHAPEHLVPLPGAFEAVRRARAAGLWVVVVTNQPGPAKGQYSRAAVAATNAHFRQCFAEAGAAIDAVYVCEHHPQGGAGGDPLLIRECDCRKPKPGLILQAARELHIDLTRSALVGDDVRDLEAARAAGIAGYRVGAHGVPVLLAVEQALRGLGVAV